MLDAIKNWYFKIVRHKCTRVWKIYLGGEKLVYEECADCKKVTYV
jgi:predicted  nucleic acid-binding Zn-ribbon protein